MTCAPIARTKLACDWTRHRLLKEHPRQRPPSTLTLQEATSIYGHQRTHLQFATLVSPLKMHVYNQLHPGYTKCLTLAYTSYQKPNTNIVTIRCNYTTRDIRNNSLVTPSWGHLPECPFHGLNSRSGHFTHGPVIQIPPLSIQVMCHRLMLFQTLRLNINYNNLLVNVLPYQLLSRKLPNQQFLNPFHPHFIH